jgi:hypothetical protein
MSTEVEDAVSLAKAIRIRIQSSSTCLVNGIIQIIFEKCRKNIKCRLNSAHIISEEESNHQMMLHSNVCFLLAGRAVLFRVRAPPWLLTARLAAS